MLLTLAPLGRCHDLNLTGGGTEAALLVGARHFPESVRGSEDHRVWS